MQDLNVIEVLEDFLKFGGIFKDDLKKALSTALSLMKELENIKDSGVLPKDICINEVIRLSVNELIPFEQIEPFKILATLLDDKVRHETAFRLIKNVSVEKLLEIMNGITAFHNHQDHPMPERYWKMIATELNRVILG